jgi:hypothetical protein
MGSSGVIQVTPDRRIGRPHGGEAFDQYARLPRELGNENKARTWRDGEGFRSMPLILRDFKVS